MNAAEELRYLILAVQREGNRRLAEALRPLGLTPAQAEVLEVVARHQPLTLLQLGERLVCEPGSPSRLVKSMVDAGWIAKTPNPDDGRAVLLALTPAAEDLLPQLRAVEEAFNAAIGAAVADDQAQQLIEALWPLAAESEHGQALLRRKEEHGIAEEAEV